MDAREEDLMLSYKEENELLRVHLKQLQVELERSAVKLLHERNKRKELEGDGLRFGQDIKEQLTEARRELYSIRSSRSWKITRPLRALTSLASKLRK